MVSTHILQITTFFNTINNLQLQIKYQKKVQWNFNPTSIHKKTNQSNPNSLNHNIKLII